MTYRICSIRRCGYYLFYHTVLCGDNLRVATNWQWHLLHSVLSVKSFVNVRTFKKCRFCKINKELWCGDLVANLPASWSAATLLHSGTYTAPPIRLVLVALHVLILPFGLFTYTLATQTLAVAIIWEWWLFYSGAATIRVWRLIDSGVWTSKYCMQLHVYISI